MERLRFQLMRTGCWLAMLVVASQLFLPAGLAQEIGTPIAPAIESTVDSTPASTEPAPEPTATPECLVDMAAPELTDIPSPSISFDGPLDFGRVQTGRDQGKTHREGTLSLTISGLDQACGVWRLRLDATPIVDGNGAVRDGFALRIGECDLTEGCPAASFVAGPDAPSTQSITLTITLQTPPYAAPGAFGTTINATIAEA